MIDRTNHTGGSTKLPSIPGSGPIVSREELTTIYPRVSFCNGANSIDLLLPDTDTAKLCRKAREVFNLGDGEITNAELVTHHEFLVDEIIRQLNITLKQEAGIEGVTLVRKLGAGRFGESFLVRAGGTDFVLKLMKAQHFEGSLLANKFALEILDPEQEQLKFIAENYGYEFDGLPRGYVYIKVTDPDEPTSPKLVGILKSLVGGISVKEALSNNSVTEDEVRTSMIKMLTRLKEGKPGLVDGLMSRDFMVEDFRILTNDKGDYLRFHDGELVLMHIDTGIWQRTSQIEASLVKATPQRREDYKISNIVRLILNPKDQKASA